MMFGKTNTKFVPVPIPMFDDQGSMLAKAREALSVPELRNWLRQRVALKAAEIAVYHKLENQSNQVSMFAGAAEELGFLIEGAAAEIGNQIAALNVTENKEEDLTVPGTHLNNLAEDVCD